MLAILRSIGISLPTAEAQPDPQPRLPRASTAPLGLETKSATSAVLTLSLYPPAPTKPRRGVAVARSDGARPLPLCAHPPQPTALFSYNMNKLLLLLLIGMRIPSYVAFPPKTKYALWRAARQFQCLSSGPHDNPATISPQQPYTTTCTGAVRRGCRTLYSRRPALLTTANSENSRQQHPKPRDTYDTTNSTVQQTFAEHTCLLSCLPTLACLVFFVCL